MACQFSDTIQSYHAGNALFGNMKFCNHLEANCQSIEFSGVSAHHQNGVAERAIQTVTHSAPCSSTRQSTGLSNTISTYGLFLSQSPTYTQSTSLRRAPLGHLFFLPPWINVPSQPPVPQNPQHPISQWAKLDNDLHERLPDPVCPSYNWTLGRFAPTGLGNRCQCKRQSNVGASNVLARSERLLGDLQERNRHTIHQKPGLGKGRQRKMDERSTWYLSAQVQSFSRWDYSKTEG